MLQHKTNGLTDKRFYIFSKCPPLKSPRYGCQSLTLRSAGMMRWVARDLMQWPVSIPGDGLIDVVVQSVVPRLTMANAIAGAEKGETYWMDCQYYYKGERVFFGWT